jgi:carbamoylphosphate synthase small subunit
MVKSHYILASIAGTAAMSLGTIGVVSAASTHVTHPGVGASGISKSVLRQDRLDAIATVLKTSPANIKAARVNKNMKQLVSQAGVTKRVFRQKYTTQLTAELVKQGYTKSQISTALHHANVHHRRNHRKQKITAQ